SVLISTISHHHTPTLFPYTTLFRSGRHGSHVPRDADGEPAGFPRGRRLRAARLRLDVDTGRAGVRADRGPAGPRHARRPLRGDEDRKSTRLNSSHVSISYAVFCLKK